MDIYVDNDFDYAAVLKALSMCEPDDALCCRGEAVFELAKKVMVKERYTDITVQLIDEDGFAVKQVVSRKRDELSVDDGFNDRQVAVIRALEKVLGHCRKEGIQLVGYSDELVALPASLSVEDVTTDYAIDVDTQGVYSGVESVLPN